MLDLLHFSIYLQDIQNLEIIFDNITLSGFDNINFIPTRYTAK